MFLCEGVRASVCVCIIVFVRVCLCVGALVQILVPFRVSVSLPTKHVGHIELVAPNQHVTVCAVLCARHLGWRQRSSRGP